MRVLQIESTSKNLCLFNCKCAYCLRRSVPSGENAKMWRSACLQSPKSQKIIPGSFGLAASKSWWLMVTEVTGVGSSVGLKFTHFIGNLIHQQYHIAKCQEGRQILTSFYWIEMLNIFFENAWIRHVVFGRKDRYIRSIYNSFWFDQF